MICRSCGHAMGLKILHGQTLDICVACGGIWIDLRELGAFLKPPKLGIAAEAIEALKKDLEWSASYDGSPSRLCPKCGKEMPRHVFAALSGISIDVCVPDGLWCDPGEFDRLADFIEKGGLQLARLAKWEEAIPMGTGKQPDKLLPRVISLLGGAAGLFARK